MSLALTRSSIAVPQAPKSLTDNLSELFLKHDGFKNLVDMNEYDYIKQMKYKNRDKLLKINNETASNMITSIDGINDINNTYKLSVDLITNNCDKRYEEYVIDKISWENKNIVFFKPLIITIRYEDDFYIVNSPLLNITTIEDSRESAINSFYDEVLFLWEDYVLEKNDNLTLDAIDLKNKLITVIKEVL